MAMPEENIQQARKEVAAGLENGAGAGFLFLVQQINAHAGHGVTDKIKSTDSAK